LKKGIMYLLLHLFKSNNYEKNFSAFGKKTKEQARLQGKNGICRWTCCHQQKKGKRKKKIVCVG